FLRSDDEYPFKLDPDMTVHWLERGPGKDYHVVIVSKSNGSIMNPITTVYTNTCMKTGIFVGALAAGHWHQSGNEKGPGPDDGGSVLQNSIPQVIWWGKGNSFGVGVVEHTQYGFRARLLAGSWGMQQSDIITAIRGMNNG